MLSEVSTLRSGKKQASGWHIGVAYRKAGAFILTSKRSQKQCRTAGA